MVDPSDFTNPVYLRIKQQTMKGKKVWQESKDFTSPVLEIIIERGKRLNRVVPSFVEIVLAFDTNI